MEFGRVYDEINGIDFSLPPDTALTKKTLNSHQTDGDFSVFTGASKWGEKSWLGKIYPKKTPDNTFLPLYAQSFNTVEFGPTFYNIYSAEDLGKWVKQVEGSPGFKFCPKFPQTITHIRRLSNAEEATAKFYQSLTAFGDHLGPLLLQLGDNFTPKNFPQLKAYLEGLPPSIKVNVDVRQKDWFAIQSNRDNLFGNNLDASDYIRLDAWVDRLKVWKGMGLKTVWFFMHQNDEGFVPKACDYFIQRLN